MYKSRQHKKAVLRTINRTKKLVAGINNIRVHPFGLALQMEKSANGDFGEFKSDLKAIPASQGEVGVEMNYLKYFPKYKNPIKGQEISLVQIVKEEENQGTAQQGNIGYEMKQVQDGKHKGWTLDADPIRKLTIKDPDVNKILLHRGDIDGELNLSDIHKFKSKILFVSSDFRYSQIRKLSTTPLFTGKKDKCDTLPEKEHTGWSIIRDGNSWFPSYACIRDRPSAPKGALKGMEFKTAALLNGTDYLDIVKWGWHLNDKDKIVVDDIEIDNGSGDTFTAVAKKWNSLYVNEDKGPQLLKKEESEDGNLFKMPEYTKYTKQ